MKTRIFLFLSIILFTIFSQIIFAADTVIPPPSIPTPAIVEITTLKPKDEARAILYSDLLFAIQNGQSQGAEPNITKFKPTKGKPGDTVVFTGTDIINVQSITFEGIADDAFTFDSLTEFSATVPQLGGEKKEKRDVQIIVTSTSGIAYNLSPLFEYKGDGGVIPDPNYEAPVITEFPLMGWKKDIKYIRGTNLLSVSSIRFVEKYAVRRSPIHIAKIKNQADDVIEIEIPNIGKVAQSDITIEVISTTDESTILTTSFIYDHYTAPEITQSPTSGWNGDLEFLRGTNLLTVTNVTFNGVTAAITNQTETEIQLTIPGLGVNTVNNVTIAAISVSGDSIPISSTFTYEEVTYIPPTITSYPTNGMRDEIVEFGGTNLLNVDSVTFNGVAGVISNPADSLIQVQIPDLANEKINDVSIVAISSIGESTTLTTSFTYEVYEAPVIRRFDAVGFRDDAAFINGLFLLNVRSVKFNGVTADIQTQTDSDIELTIPDLGDNEINNVTVEGISVTGDIIPISTTFTYYGEKVVYPAPEFTSIPSTVKKGKTVEFVGTNLEHIISIDLSGKLAENMTINDNFVEFTVPDLGKKTINNVVVTINYLTNAHTTSALTLPEEVQYKKK